MEGFCGNCIHNLSSSYMHPISRSKPGSSYRRNCRGTMVVDCQVTFSRQILPDCIGKGTYIKFRKVNSYSRVVASIDQFMAEDFEVERLLGTYGYMKVSSYTPQSGKTFGIGLGENIAAGFDQRDISRMRGQDISQGDIQTRLYAARIVRGQLAGTRVLLKAYPGRAVGGIDADIMAANELSSHAQLQEPSAKEVCPNISVLLGGFQTRTGEQWLVFRDDGRITAADYAKAASEATVEGRAVGEWDFLDQFDPRRPIQRRRVFITKLLRGTFIGLSYMHSSGLLHQSLGPTSIIMNTMQERDALFLLPRLRDLAFAADISDQGLFGSAAFGNSSVRDPSPVFSAKDLPLRSAAASLSEDLWRRASAAGARMSLERKAYGLADDIYAGGLLLAYIVFVCLSEPGSIDGASLQRLLESTFQLDIGAARDYCLADDRWKEAVSFLELDDGAGWQLLQAMLNPNFRQRPTADAVLNHRFLTGAIL